MEIVEIEFKSDIVEIVSDGFQWVAIKTACKNMGLNFDTQHKKISSDDSFESKLIKIQTAGGMQNVFCIPLNKLNGWLFSISVNRVKPEVKKKLIAYKNECFNVLYKHFNPTLQSEDIKHISLLNDIIRQLKDDKAFLSQTILSQNKLIASQSSAPLLEDKGTINIYHEEVQRLREQLEEEKKMKVHFNQMAWLQIRRVEKFSLLEEYIQKLRSDITDKLASLNLPQDDPLHRELLRAREIMVRTTLMFHEIKLRADEEVEQMHKNLK